MCQSFIINKFSCLWTAFLPFSCTFCGYVFWLFRYDNSSDAAPETTDSVHKTLPSRPNIKIYTRYLTCSFIKEWSKKPTSAYMMNFKLCQYRECDKAFSLNEPFIMHLRTHTGDKPYQCSQCKKYFSWKGYITCQTTNRPYTLGIDHINAANVTSLWSERTPCYRMRIHTGEKPYQCSQCDKIFTHKSEYSCHKSNILIL